MILPKRMPSRIAMAVALALLLPATAVVHSGPIDVTNSNDPAVLSTNNYPALSTVTGYLLIYLNSAVVSMAGGGFRGSCASGTGCRSKKTPPSSPWATFSQS